MGQGPRALVLEKGHQVRELDRFPVRQALLLGPGDELAQQRGVGPLGVLGLPAFVAEVLEEVLDQLIHASFWPVNRS